MSSNSARNLEDLTWKAPTSSQNTTTDVVKDTAEKSNFDKGVLEEEWYTPETSLMELSYSSSYEMQDAPSNFSLLEPSLNFDSVNSHASFRLAPSINLGMSQLQGNGLLDNLACTGQGSSVSLLSNIPPGGQLGHISTMDSYSQGIIFPGSSVGNIASSSINARSVNLPPSFADAYSVSALNQNKPGEGGSGVSRNDFVLHHTSKQAKSCLPGQQTLFQKGAASRRSVAGGTVPSASKSPSRVFTSASNDSSMDTRDKESPHTGNASRAEMLSGSDDPNDIRLDGDDYDPDESGDGSGGPYEVEEGAGNGAENHGNSKIKGKRGLPAKNLMAERRRRKKLNDRLYMLRAMVPKITKMDRASILGDAIEYLKELLQRINDIHSELDAAKQEQSRSMPSSPTPRSAHQGCPPKAKEECPMLPNPETHVVEPPRVEVRKREGQALNIHMFCARRPGLLLSTVRALDALGLDVQQAVISCFNGFALDLFRAEAKDADVEPDEIKAVLLLTARRGMHPLQ
nr:hypothetical protein PHYPA_002772 [Physcomitrium patens]